MVMYLAFDGKGKLLSYLMRSYIVTLAYKTYSQKYIPKKCQNYSKIKASYEVEATWYIIISQTDIHKYGPLILQQFAKVMYL